MPHRAGRMWCHDIAQGCVTSTDYYSYWDIIFHQKSKKCLNMKCSCKLNLQRFHNAVCLYINKTAIATISTYFAVWHTTQRDFLLKLRHGECIVRIIKSKYTHLFFFPFSPVYKNRMKSFYIAIYSASWIYIILPVLPSLRSFGILL